MLEIDAVVCFCRFTQLGLLRLLTNRSAVGEDVLPQAQAWEAFDAFLANPGNRMMEEPQGIDPLFRRLTDRKEASTKQWARTCFIKSLGVICFFSFRRARFCVVATILPR